MAIVNLKFQLNTVKSLHQLVNVCKCTNIIWGDINKEMLWRGPGFVPGFNAG